MDYWITRLCFQRAMAFMYFWAFLVALFQAKPLIGEKGLLPAQNFLARVNFWDSPSLFHFHFSNTAILFAAGLGLTLSMVAMLGYSEKFGYATSIATWFSMWLLYLSFVNVGQTFYGFGWEMMILEAGFLSIFLGPAKSAPPVLIFWLFKWLAFRNMFGAGMIKIRGDQCWLDLTCMNYHYETQPVPNPLSKWFHFLPPWYHKFEVAVTHFVELIVPFFLFTPKKIATWAAVIIIFFQINIAITGNLAFLNFLSIVIMIACLNDDFLRHIIPLDVPVELESLAWHKYSVYGLTGLVAFLSYRPIVNLISPRQAMNRSFDPFHIVNTYGAFGSITKSRREVIIEGTRDNVITDNSVWYEYEFKSKPGNPWKIPGLMSPYHRRLDWQIWFAAMNNYRYHPWILNLANKLLQNDKDVLSLLATNPFPQEPPKYIRMQHYDYKFSKESGRVWDRKLIGPYLPPLSLSDPNFQNIIKSNKWD